MSAAPTSAAPARTLVLVVAPSLGLLDSWLPVVTAARERRGVRVIAVVPERETVLAVDASDTMVRLADAVVDAVVVPAVDGGWLAAPSLVAARGLVASERAATLAARAATAVLWRLGRRRRHGVLPRTLRRALRPLRPRAVRAAAASLSALVGDDAHVCYDVHVHRRPAAAALLAELDGLPRSSLHHGIDVLVDDGRRFPLARPELDVHVGLFSALERPAHRAVHGLDDRVLDVVGIPRHDPDWLERVIAASRAEHTVPVEGAVFVLSRPAGSSYLPRARKEAALAALHRVVVEELGLPLVVKLHPKEREDGTLERALPTAEEGRTWHRVRAHPFHVARHALAAVAFHSGVLIDMVALGVPAIELIDVRGLPEHDRADAPRDDRGRPIHSALRRHGLVLPADDADDLRAQLARVAADRAGVVAALRAAYDAAFPDPRGAIDRMLAGLVAPAGARGGASATNGPTA